MGGSGRASWARASDGPGEVRRQDGNGRKEWMSHLAGGWRQHAAEGMIGQSRRRAADKRKWVNERVKATGSATRAAKQWWWQREPLSNRSDAEGKGRPPRLWEEENRERRGCKVVGGHTASGS
ncbi:hypothetical protein NL676_018229 [Syzygium grande]|nr:hypothetical protein NL676_018229 [Syzygium grande]